MAIKDKWRNFIEYGLKRKGQKPQIDENRNAFIICGSITILKESGNGNAKLARN